MKNICHLVWQSIPRSLKLFLKPRLRKVIFNKPSQNPLGTYPQFLYKATPKSSRKHEKRKPSKPEHPISWKSKDIFLGNHWSSSVSIKKFQVLVYSFSQMHPITIFCLYIHSHQQRAETKLVKLQQPHDSLSSIPLYIIQFNPFSTSLFIQKEKKSINIKRKIHINSSHFHTRFILFQNFILFF